MVKTGSTTSYAYGPDGSRIRTTAIVGTNPAETSYLIGSSELDPAGVLTKIPHPDVRIYGSTECFVHRNHLASVTLETGASASVVQRQRYTAFGEHHRHGLRRGQARRPPSSATTPTPG